MRRRKTVGLTLLIVFYSSFRLFGQCSAANSGTTNNLNGAYLFGSGIAFVVGEGVVSPARAPGFWRGRDQFYRRGAKLRSNGFY
jgi:hypothetical protein